MNKVNYYGDDEEDLNHYDVRGLLRFSLVSTPDFRLYLAGGAMYGQSYIPYRDYYTSWYWRWGGWCRSKHWYSETATGSILGGLAGGGAELSLGRLVVHANVLTLVGGGSSDEYVYEDCDIGDGTMISVDAQFALTDSFRIGLYYQNESFGDGESSIDMTTYGAMLGFAF